MVIIMEMSSGRTEGGEFRCDSDAYGDEVLNAGWTDVPCIEARLEEVAVATHGAPASVDIETVMACLYAYQA